jgi:AcrR family transcriptional regulator
LLYNQKILTPPKADVTDIPTEEKIKAAALRIFTEKGYGDTKTRDIAAEAGITMAMLNYYYRSKEKLFAIVMQENLQKLISGIDEIFFDETTPLEKKIELFIDCKIDTFLKTPNLAGFILNEFKRDPGMLAERFGKVKDSSYIKQFNEAVRAGKIAAIDPIHFLFNLGGLLVFPFLAGPILQGAGVLSQEHYEEIILERKKMVPLWLKAIVAVKP